MNTNTRRIRKTTRWLPLALLAPLYGCVGQMGDRSPVAPVAHPPAIVIPQAATADSWRTPVNAMPVRDFGDGSVGLDYSLPPDTVIRAASSGVVVYAGPGIGGFRHLVIVKTSKRHLVAYAFDASPLLRQGEAVNQGDTVARAATDATDFHFEIRDRGTPVDPRSLILDAI